MKKAIILVLSILTVALIGASFTACSHNRLSTPQNVTFDEDNNMTWDAVEHAKGYLIEATNVENGEVTSLTPRKSTCSLSELSEGDYNVKIQALPASRKYTESKWTKDFYFKKFYETGCLYSLINNDREYEISRVGKASGSFVIEDEYRGQPVTRIADGAFRRSKAITAVTIGNNVLYVGSGAFANCVNLTTVVFPDCVEEIGDSCFLSCSSLKNVSMPLSLTSINAYLFSYCTSLENINLCENIKTIAESAFDSCSSLQSIDIPDSVTSIEESAFADCTSLKKVTIGSGVVSIGEGAFEKCNLSEGVVFSENSSLTSIGNRAFTASKGLPKINIPEGVASLGTNCFSSCEKLTEITIPDSCTFLGSYIVYKTPIHPEDDGENDTVYYADKWVVGVSQHLKKTLQYVGGSSKDSVKIYLQEDTVGIASMVFAYCNELLQVSIPDSVKYICHYAFYDCEKLNSFGTGVTSELYSLGQQVFADCLLLSNVTLSEKLEKIGAYCFSGCERLSIDNEEFASYVVPNSVKSIGAKAFEGTGIMKKAVNGLYYANNWVVGISVDAPATVTLRDGTKGIADYAFMQGSEAKNQLKAVENTEGLIYIGEGAFYMAEGLEKFNISTIVRNIGNFTFYGCSSLESVGEPTSLKSIGRSAFYGCQKLYTMNLQSCYQLETIGPFAFGYCTALASVQLPENAKLSAINPYTFYQCDALFSITLPKTITTIGDSAFFECNNLTTLRFLQSETAIRGLNEIGKDAFYQCYNLRNIDIPNTVTTIGDSAFFGCASIETLDIGDGVTKIESNAFCGLSSLTDLEIGRNVKYIGNYAFSSCYSLTSISIPKEVEYIGAYAFYQCDLATFYTDATEKNEDWHNRFNASYRPVVWGVTLSDDGYYLVSVTKNANMLANENEYNLLTSPSRKGYTFKGFSKTQDSTVAEYSISDLKTLQDGTVLYAVWEEKLPDDTASEEGTESGTESGS